MEQTHHANLGTLSIVTRTEDDLVVIEIIGELDMASASGLRTCLADAMAVVSPPRIAVDARSLSFCDSTGLSVLAAAHQAVRALGGRLALTGVSGPFARVLTVTGLNRLFIIVPTLDDARRNVHERS
ncbi:STAS domain-containing protein [Sphaerisporangium sp. TRM90804]|uniref:STAS domain-containing protein n=1 Tax=Sphaerisporangium sp. TRM90804 TaxID=3031113 RepID=UPI00244CB590|nr:STAS domain-containing protein [Sphaerisporangium sp. TRM90804]MDH2426361.1 STAS domain-containing protein [Sphaerisporangium sp. TRM90804]